MVSLYYSSFAENFGCRCFWLLLVFLFPVCFFNLILKALIVGISRPSLHVYIKNLPNSNIWLSVFQLLFFIGLKTRQVSFVRFTFWLSSRFNQFSNVFHKD